NRNEDLEDFKEIHEKIKKLEKKKQLTNKEKRELKNKRKESNKLFRPDDNVGGTITFDFTDDVGVLFDSINLLDFDEANDPKFSFTFADGYKIKNATVDNNNNIGVQLLSDNWITNLKTGKKEKTNENSLREYNFNFKDEEGNLRKVTEFSITLPGSGAVTGLSYYREETKKLARKVPEPTSILGLAAISGLAAASLKRKRKSSDI
ncbi:MAG: PEP-CTERM sorting domain-containing protein, partial [Cyanobacteria bacterium J06573_2]